MRSTKRQPSALWQPKDVLRHSTPLRSSRSAWLLVGSTPSLTTKRHRAGSTAVHAFLEVAFEVGPTDSPLQHWPQLVDAKAVAAQDAAQDVAQQGGQTCHAAAGVDDEDGNAGGGGQPQPAFGAALFPTGFID